MVAGGSPAQKRAVITFSIGGAIVASVAFGAARCIPPDGPTYPEPVPTVTVVEDSAAPAPDVSVDSETPEASLPKCEFVGPRARGAKRRETRIVGGNPAKTGAFPFAAALTTASGFQFCGASIIGARYALTAAHCQVEAGDRVLTGSTDLVQMRQVAVIESRIHPRFSQDTMDYDVAIAVLAADAGVPAVTIATGVLSLDATVIGWGKTCEACPTTQHLREVSIPLWEPAQCLAAYDGITSRQVCAGLAGGGKDSCQGDSGGSLLTWNLDHWEQLGIVSWGIGCARPNAPGVYSDLRAPEMRQWVEACSR